MIEELRQRPNSDDYLLITSSQEDEKSSNWSTDVYDEMIWNHICSAKPVSDLRLCPADVTPIGMESDFPMICGQFDVVI